MHIRACCAFPCYRCWICRYKKAEVTGGGIKLTELDLRSMEVLSCPSLFVCGEIVDVFGRIGGFNFYWAWVSGRAAGLGAVGIPWPAFEGA